MHDELEKDIDECTTDSVFMSGSERKTLSELDEIIADYHPSRKFKESRMQAMHPGRRHMEGNALQDVFATCINEYRFTEEEAIASASRTPPTKQLTVTPAAEAPPPAKVSPPNKLPNIDSRLCISCSKVRPVLSALHDVAIDLSAVQSPGPPRRRHHPALVTRLPSKVLHLLFPPRTIFDHHPHRPRKRHILAVSSPFSSRL